MCAKLTSDKKDCHHTTHNYKGFFHIKQHISYLCLLHFVPKGKQTTKNLQTNHPSLKALILFGNIVVQSLFLQKIY